MSSSNNKIDLQKDKNDNQQQLIMRDDIIQFSFDVVASARNKYKNKSHARYNSHGTSMELTSTQPKSSIKINPALNPILQKPNKNIEIFSSAYEKVHQYFTQYDKAKRASFTTKNNRYREMSDPKMAKSQSANIQQPKTSRAVSFSNNQHSSSQAVIPDKDRKDDEIFKSFKRSTPNNFKLIQRKHAKKQMKDDAVQNWLNQVLIQISPHLQIDKRSENGGLKAYKIDRSSLLMIGINPDNINRLYRSFFVYSIGFNNLLKDICLKNAVLQNSVWRVFALLLEYCSEGNFDTMIGEIERDKQIKLMEMKKEIQNRQKLIEKSDQLHDQKNAKILREIRQLEEKTKQLQQQRTSLLNQFHQTEQAFHEEVALRLKYQVRINQVHGLHEQLIQKYKILKEQHFRNQQICKSQKENITSLRKQMADLKSQLEDKMKTIKGLQFYVKQLHLTIQKRESTLKTTNETLIQMKNNLESADQQIQQKNRQVQQLKINIQNMLSSAKCSTQIIKSKGQQFVRAMKENAQLHEHIHKNLIDINRMAQEKRELGHKTTQVAALIAVFSRKVQEQQKQIAHAKRLIDQLGEETSMKEVDYKAERDRAEALQDDIEVYIQNIKQLKAKQNETSILLQQANITIKNLQQIISNRKTDQQKYTVQIQNLKAKLSQVKIEIQQKQKRAKLAQDQIQSTNQLWKCKFTNLNEQLIRTKEKLEKIEGERRNYSQEIEIYKEKYDKIYIQYKDEKFERNNLELYYKQSLTVLEEEIEHIKRLNIQMSETKQAIEQSRRKYNALQLIHQHKTEMFENDLKIWKEKCETLQLKSNQRQHYIHPLLYEDVCASYLRLQQRTHKLSEAIKQYKIQRNRLQSEKLALTQELKKIEKKPKDSTEKQYQSQISKRDNEISYLKQKVEYQSGKLMESEENLLKAYKQKNTAIQMLRNAQSQFMNKINERNNALKELNEKYRNLLQLNEEQLSQNQKLASKLENKSSKDIKIKVDEGSPRGLLTNQRFSPKSKQKKFLKPQQNDLMKPKKITEDRLPSQNVTQNNNPKFEMNGQGEEHEENGNVSFYEQLKLKQVVDLQDENETLKRRQDIRRKIKGAYLYYLK